MGLLASISCCDRRVVNHFREILASNRITCTRLSCRAARDSDLLSVFSMIQNTGGLDHENSRTSLRQFQVHGCRINNEGINTETIQSNIVLITAASSEIGEATARHRDSRQALPASQADATSPSRSGQSPANAAMRNIKPETT
jgi:hypothetical protein